MADQSLDARRIAREQEGRMAASASIGLNAVKPFIQFQPSMIRVFAVQSAGQNQGCAASSHFSELQVSQRASSFQLVPSPISGARLQTLKSSLSQSGEGVHRRGGRPVRLLCDQSNALE